MHHNVNHTAALISLATAVPPHLFHQDQILQAARTVMADRYPEFETLSSLFANTGIRRRYGAKPMEWYLERRGWPERTQAFLEAAEALFLDVARKAIAQADLEANEVDTIVTVSSTGVATPSLEARVAGRIGVRTGRLPRARLRSRLRGRGYRPVAGRTPRRGEARHQRPPRGGRALHPVRPPSTRPTKANLVAVALFGDGAAAGGRARRRCSRRRERRRDRGRRRAHLARHARHHGLVRQHGRARRHLSTVPSRPSRRDHLAPAVDQVLSGDGKLGRRDIDRFVCHPGGTKVVLPPSRPLWTSSRRHRLTHERDVLAKFGNMSAPTALFVLERVLDAGMPDRIALTALGPGFTLSCAALRRDA